MDDAQGSDTGRPGEGQLAAPLRIGEGTAQPANRAWKDLLGRAVFEILIVAIGVLLALAVDEWREHQQQRQLADAARAAFRTEVLANRDRVILRQRRVAQLYKLVSAHPEEAGRLVFERRSRPLLLYDAAWTSAVQTGALRWLAPAERTILAELYTAQNHTRELATQEVTSWTELAAIDPEPRSAEDARDRARLVRVWLAYAQRVQLSQCVNAGRYERVLGARVRVEQLIEFCAAQPPDEDPVHIYRQLQRRGWTSGSEPRALTASSATVLD
jgi:hypothetical protein